MDLSFDDNYILEGDYQPVLHSYKRRIPLRKRPYIIIPIILALIIGLYFVILKMWSINMENSPPADQPDTIGSHPLIKSFYPKLINNKISLSLRLTILSEQLTEATCITTITFSSEEIYSILTLNASTSTVSITGITALINEKDTPISFEHKQSQVKLLFTYPKTFEPNQENNYVLTIYHKTSITKNMKGFYRSNGDNGAILSTHFEPRYSDLAFPSFNIPSFKYNFNLTIKAPSHLQILSNMPIKSSLLSKKHTSLTKTIFKETPPMSIYLAAWVIGRLNILESKTKSGLSIKAYTDKNSYILNFGLNTAVKAIELFEEKLKISYTLPKLDLVVIPDFKSGAMENWGLVNFKASQFEIYSDSPVFSKISTAKTIIHEIAHQWFGNLVTLLEWQYLWLNEGFARFFGDLFFEEMFKNNNFLVNYNRRQHLLPVLSFEGFENTRPLLPVNFKENYILQIFDQISYSKGGSFILMLKSLFTEEKHFYQILNNYLNKNKFNNVKPSQLLDSFTEYIKSNPSSLIKFDNINYKPSTSIENIFASIFDTFHKNKGVPLISGSITSPEDATSDHIKLTFTQTRFKFKQTSINKIENVIWAVPLTFTVFYENGSKIEYNILLKNISETFEINKNKGKNPILIILNPKTDKYFIPDFKIKNTFKIPNSNVLDSVEIILDENNITELQSYLNFIPLWLKSRKATLYEIFDKLNGYLDITTLIQQNVSPTIFYELIRGRNILLNQQREFFELNSDQNYENLNNLNKFIIRDYLELKENLKSFLNSKNFLNLKNPLNLKNLLNSNSMDLGISANVSLLNYILDKQLIDSNHKETILFYYNIFNKGCDSPETHKNLLCYYSAVKFNKEKESFYEELIQIYEKESSSEKRIRILESLGNFSDETIIKRVLEFGLKSDKVRMQDRYAVIKGVVLNPQFREYGIDFIVRNWKILEGIYEGGNSLLNFLRICGRSYNVRNVKVLKDLLGDNEKTNVVLGHVIERIEINYDYFEFNEGLELNLMTRGVDF